MNLRYVVPAFGLMALTASAASAQEIAKGVTLDGYLDTIATATSNSAPSGYTDPSTTDFYTEACLKVGWAITDKVKTVISTRTFGDSAVGVGNNSFVLAEGYASVQATPELTVSAGKSAGPFGYYSFYPTGLTTTNYALTVNMYTVNPVGVWAAYAASDKVTITAILADGFAGQGGSSGFPRAAYKVNGDVSKVNKPGTVSPGLDVVFNPTSEISLNLEGYVDPAGYSTGPGLENGNIYFVGFNGQYKKDKILAGGEVLYQVIQKGGDTTDDDGKNLSWAAFLTYTLPTTMPMAATAQFSMLMPDAAGAGAPKDTISKFQLALLTNPFTESTFGLNYELFAIQDGKKGNDAVFGGTENKAVTTFGFSIEGLFVIP